MSQSLIVAWGLEIPHSTRQQISNARACIEQLSRDPRIKTVYGATGQSTGCVVLVDVPNQQEVLRLVSLMQVSGLPNTQVIPLIGEQQLKIGLEEAEKISGSGGNDGVGSQAFAVPQVGVPT